MLTSMICAPCFDLLARDDESAADSRLLDQLAEFGGARDVRALAYVDERLRCIADCHCFVSFAVSGSSGDLSRGNLLDLCRIVIKMIR